MDSGPIKWSRPPAASSGLGACAGRSSLHGGLWVPGAVGGGPLVCSLCISCLDPAAGPGTGISGLFLGWHGCRCRMRFMLLLYITFLLQTISIANSRKYCYSLVCTMTCSPKYTHTWVAGLSGLYFPWMFPSECVSASCAHGSLSRLAHLHGVNVASLCRTPVGTLPPACPLPPQLAGLFTLVCTVGGGLSSGAHGGHTPEFTHRSRCAVPCSCGGGTFFLPAHGPCLLVLPMGLAPAARVEASVHVARAPRLWVAPCYSAAPGL